MANENAKKFVEKVASDAALAERLKKEGLALAKEMGLEFTEEELKEVLNNRELGPEELAQGAGGGIFDDLWETVTDTIKRVLKTEPDPVIAPLPFP